METMKLLFFSSSLIPAAAKISPQFHMQARPPRSIIGTIMITLREAFTCSSEAAAPLISMRGQSSGDR
jgi:hypothetical protein